jgi:nucleotide-binding universal stress UspA family protein
VALTGRRAPIAAIGMARLIARALGAPLHGLFAWSSPLPVSQVPKMLRLTPEALEGMVLEVTEVEPAAALAAAAAAHPTAFLVIAADPNPTDPLGVGVLAYEALQRTTAALVIVPGSAPPADLERILVPLDGTPSTASALGPAGDLARRISATVHILIVGQDRPSGAPPEEPGTMAPPQYVDQPHHEWAAFSKEFLQRFVDTIGGVPQGVRTRLYLGAGPPAQEILRFAGELETHLLVLVWHGELEGDHGAVFREVVRAAPCPILVLRAGST